MWDWMRGMDEYYIKCLVGVSLISVIILLIRFFLGKKLSKRFTYGMWVAIPLFLLLVPFVRIPMPQVMANLGQETWEKLEGEVYTIILPKDFVIEKDNLADTIRAGALANTDGMGSESEESGGVAADKQKSGTSIATIFAKVLVVLYGVVVLGILAGIMSTNVLFEHKCRHNRVYLGETSKSKELNELSP